MTTSWRLNNFAVAGLSGKTCVGRLCNGYSYVEPLRDIEQAAPQIDYTVSLTSLEQPSVPVLVVDHTHPDTDAVCSILAYAALHQRWTGETTQACHLDDLTEETLWVLEHFHITPEYIVHEPNINSLL